MRGWRHRRLGLLVLGAIALPVSGAVASQPPTGWDGTNPFACELQQAGFGAVVAHPEADPFCIEFDKRRQNITQLGIVDFLLNEPARVAAAVPKCWYFQSDHWRASIVQDDASTKLYEFDGHYFFDKATGDGGVWVTNFNVNGHTFDPSSIPGIPSEFARYFGPGTGGVITRNGVKADPGCVEQASARPPYAQPRPGVDPGTGRGCVGAKGSAGPARIGEVGLGDREGTIRARLGDPQLVRRGFLRWCLTSGGSVRAGVPGDRSGAFGSGDDQVAVVVATSPTYRLNGVGPRSTARALRRAFPRAAPYVRVGMTRWFALRRDGRVLAGIRGGRVSALAVTGAAVAKNRRALRDWLSRAR
jgi:hypothetical protein